MCPPDARVELLDEQTAKRNNSHENQCPYPRPNPRLARREVTVSVSITPAFASATDAAKAARAALGFLAAVAPAELVTEEQAQCLRIL
jgi:hypothetical protein